MTLTTIIPIALIAVNIVTFCVYGIDKHKARHHRHRISEEVLLSLAFCCGAPGALLGMLVFHHKTRHKRFTILVPVFLIFQIILAGMLISTF